jgi:hypothetical protein
MGDSMEAVQDMARRYAYNGSSSLWCLSCARKLSGTADPPLSMGYDRDSVWIPLMALAVTVGTAILVIWTHWS